MTKSPIYFKRSTILIDTDTDAMIEQLKISLPLHQQRLIRNQDEKSDEFLLSHANLAIKEAHIATSEKKYIILCATSFRKEAQNALLKLLEEPPSNIIFILVTPSKSSLLPTVLSRMPHITGSHSHQSVPIDLNLVNLELKELYHFLKENQKLSKDKAKEVIQSLLYSVQKDRIVLTQKELDHFSMAIKLIELNSKPIHILTSLLLTIMHRKNNSHSLAIR